MVKLYVGASSLYSQHFNTVSLYAVSLSVCYLCVDDDMHTRCCFHLIIVWFCSCSFCLLFVHVVFVFSTWPHLNSDVGLEKGEY